MKGIAYDRFGPPDVLQLVEMPAPQVRPHDLLVRVAAAGVNRADLMQRAGFYGGQTFGDSPLLGLELAGEVIEVGPGVTDMRVGDRVMAIVGGGAYAEVARVDRGMAVRVPDGLPLREAAGVMEAFVTAWEAVAHLARVQPGQRVLIHAAAGGIGSAAVQVARALGATVYATASAQRAADVRGLGAAAVIDYRATDFETEVSRLTEAAGVHAVIDFIGGDYLARNLRSLTPGGTLVQVGVLSGDADTPIPLDLVLHHHLRLIGTVMKSRTPEEKRAMVARFAAGALPRLASGEIHAVIDRVLPLEQAAEAHQRMERGGGFGKIILAVEKG
ncbi:NAD(P)H-quinone oxidoreductase [Nitrospirillum viridazoti]|uniref:Quinone oxidoreductase n=1 Tax=Nitrospirillum viridazoti CBAmc TaxID=1441467 RepID=A0A248JRC6_9PROT|nr:NAD(P)H-quinone oxidoreductase [Nitrospirillum amazonense]ASG21303.1 quinone oxidoreductase [Nitrospirillum amazonense CBAmc]TWB32969.1 NADPH2:quinone reductase [Nitrospirillum amazonense]